MELVNPILHRELRQGLLGRRMLLIQWFFVAALALMVWLAWPREPKFQFKQVEVAQHLFSLFWAGVYFAVCVVAAAMSAMAITREKEVGAFEMLCTTGMSTAHVLIGKFLSVVGFLVLLVVSSMPVAAACYLMGGVDWQFLSIQYLHLVAAVLLYGAIGLVCSCFCERNHHALTAAFFITLPLAAWSVWSPKAKLYIELGGLLLLLMRIEHIVERVRRPREEYQPPEPTAQTIQISVDTDSALDRLLIPHRSNKPFSDDKNPVFEREWLEESVSEARAWWHFLLRFTIVIAVVVTIALVVGRMWLQDRTLTEAQFDASLARYASMALWGLFTYMIGMAILVGPAQSANAISKERERQTADLLATTLLRPREIVLGKWWLSLRSSLHLLLLLLLPLLPLLVLIGFGKRGGIASLVLSAVCGLLIVLATQVTLNTLGVFFSFLCESSAQALAASYSVAVGWFVGPVVLYQVLTTFSEVPAVTYAWATYATPFLSFFLLSGWDVFQKGIVPAHPLVFVGIFLALTALVNVVLLTIMVLGFQRLWRRA